MKIKNRETFQNSTSKTALLLIDVISDFEFEDGEKLCGSARSITKSIKVLINRAKKVGIPVIYVNDNLGKWRDDFQKTIKHCLHKESRGGEIVKLLKPAASDFFVLKSRHSGFFRRRSICCLKTWRLKR